MPLSIEERLRELELFREQYMAGKLPQRSALGPGVVDAAKIKAGAITADKIAAGAVTADSIAVDELAAVAASTGDLTVDGDLTIGAGGSITDADGSTWDQTGITLKSPTATGDFLAFYANDVHIATLRADSGVISLRYEDSFGLLELGDDSWAFGLRVLPGGLPSIDGSSIGMYVRATGGLFALPNGGTVTIASGVIEIGDATAVSSMLTVDTEGAAASDNLDTINGGSYVGTFTVTPETGSILILRAANDARTVVVTNSGNIRLNGGASRTLDDTRDRLMLMWDDEASQWVELSFSSNG